MHKLSIINLVLVSACLVSGFGCSYLNRSDANSSNLPANKANSNASSAATPAADAPLLPATRLFDMLAKDVKGFNDQFKDREMIVIGEVDEMEANSFYFTAGYGKKISCTLSAEGRGEKAESLQKFVDQYVAKTRPKMPIVEARGVFRSGIVIGSETTALMEKCSIVSIKE